MAAPRTDMQLRFAAAFATNGGDKTAAAIEAGYSEKSAKDIGRRTFELPHVQDMIMAALTRQRARAGAIGLNALAQIAACDKAPAAARVAASRGLMEFAGLVGSGRIAESDMGTRAPGESATDYKAVLDAFANLSRAAGASDGTLLQ